MSLLSAPPVLETSALSEYPPCFAWPLSALPLPLNVLVISLSVLWFAVFSLEINFKLMKIYKNKISTEDMHIPGIQISLLILPLSVTSLHLCVCVCIFFF